jgi:hypothetical protein
MGHGRRSCQGAPSRPQHLQHRKFRKPSGRGHVVDAGVLWSRLEGVPHKRRSSSMAARRETPHASCKYIVGERQRAVIELALSIVVAWLH